MGNRTSKRWIDTSNEAGRDFVKRNIQGPVVMLNLLRFNKVADYSATPGLAPSAPISGAEAYKLYIEHTKPFLDQSGGEIILLAQGGSFLVGPPEEKWDLAMLVKQSSASAFVSFSGNQDFLRGLGHRMAALEDSRLLPLVECSLEDLLKLFEH